MWGIILICNQATFPKPSEVGSKASAAPVASKQQPKRHSSRLPPLIMALAEAVEDVHGFFLLLVFHSTLATRINISSSFTGIQLVSTFIAFSKSDSNSISRVPSISAAETAWRTSRPPLKDDGEGEREADGSGSPRSMKTSQTRSWAGKGME